MTNKKEKQKRKTQKKRTKKSKGRRYTMTISALLMALLIFLFILATEETELLFLVCLLSLITQVFYAGLMCYTPEAYPTDIRTTASGIATAIRHIANILGPIVGGKIFGETVLILCVGNLIIVAIVTATLPFDTRKSQLETLAHFGV